MAATRTRLSPSGKFQDIDQPSVDGLTSLLFVDPATTLDPADQTGSAVAPFATLGQGVSAIAALGNGALFLVDGDYAAEGLTWAPDADPGVAHTLELVGTGGATNLGDISVIQPEADTGVSVVFRAVGTPTITVPATGTITCTGIVQIVAVDSYLGPVAGDDTALGGSNFQVSSVSVDGFRASNVTVDGVVIVEGELQIDVGRFNDAVTAGDPSGGPCRLLACRFDSPTVDLSAAISVEARDCTFVGAASLGFLTASDCTFSAELTSNTLSLTNCIGNGAIEADDGTIFGGRFGGDLTFTASLVLRQTQVITDGFPDITANILTVQDCELNANIETTDDATFDLKSYGFQRLSGAALTVGGDLLFSDTFELVVSQEGYTAAAPLVLDALPDTAPPGIYLSMFCAVNRVAPASGTITNVVTFPAPNGVSATLNLGNFASATPGAVIGSATRGYTFAGGAPMQVTITPAAIVGTPEIDITVVTRWIAPLAFT